MEQFKKLDKNEYDIDKEEFIECRLEAGQEKCLVCKRAIEIVEVIYVFGHCTHWICVDCVFEYDECYYCPMLCNKKRSLSHEEDSRCFLTVTDRVAATWAPLKLIRVKLEEQEEEIGDVKREYLPYEEWYRRDGERDKEISLLRKRVRDLEETVERLSKKINF